jgi:protein-S-isoprenylcysteine O-methyltransferase Ste14
MSRKGPVPVSLLEHKIPPPVVALLCAAAMWYVAGHTPAVVLPATIRIAAAALLLVAGFAVMLAGVLSFRRVKTTVNPLKPETATALVTSGVYRYTRNPMYLGMLVVLLAWAVYLSAPATVVGIVVFWLYIERFQIRPEEKALVALFGSTFTDYSSRVRRWL